MCVCVCVCVCVRGEGGGEPECFAPLGRSQRPSVCGHWRYHDREGLLVAIAERCRRVDFIAPGRRVSTQNVAVSATANVAECKSSRKLAVEEVARSRQQPPSSHGPVHLAPFLLRLGSSRTSSFGCTSWNNLLSSRTSSFGCTSWNNLLSSRTSSFGCTSWNNLLSSRTSSSAVPVGTIFYHHAQVLSAVPVGTLFRHHAQVLPLYQLEQSFIYFTNSYTWITVHSFLTETTSGTGKS